MKNFYCAICSKYKKFAKPKISSLLEKTLVSFYYLSMCKNEDEKVFKEEESIEILKIIGFINNIEQYWKM